LTSSLERTADGAGIGGGYQNDAIGFMNRSGLDQKRQHRITAWPAGDPDEMIPQRTGHRDRLSVDREEAMVGVFRGAADWRVAGECERSLHAVTRVHGRIENDDTRNNCVAA